MKDYSEDHLVEQPAMQLLKELGWEIAFGYNTETFDENGKFGRASDSELLLQRHLLPALQRLNPGLPAQAYEVALQRLQQSASYQSMTEINQSKYKVFLEGISVDYKNQKGELITDHKLRLFDLSDYTNNHFLAIQQLWVRGKIYRRRPDIIGFVNGIPLLFIELKAAYRNLKKAYDENFSDYLDTIPELFHYNAFVLLSNGIQSRVGSITSKYQYFHEWKRISDEEEEGIVSLETILRGVCDRNRFMDLFENFILFDDGGGKLSKIIARNHQFLGVNNAIASVQQMKEREGRLGVFWHTQGSGKSYSMVFFAQKVHRKQTGSYTFLIVTDRKELDRQIYSTFADVGVVQKVAGGKKSPVQAQSGTHLKKLLTSNQKYLFTIIHKFHTAKGKQYETITERDNIIVMSDEAHRTQGGSFALNMRNALPNASYIGFTGTPLFKNDEITKRIFGDYVSVYDFLRSVEDGSTVPLYYENRGELLELDNPKINQKIRKKIEKAELNTTQSAKMERLFAKDYPVLTAKKRLRSVAKDVVKHFNIRGNKGKGMLICLDKLTAVKMYEYIDEFWKKRIKKFKKEIPQKAKDEQHEKELLRELQWMKETEYAVVVSPEQNEVKKFRKWGLDIQKHRQKMNERDLETDFKDEDHPFRLVIVCAMWLTGFDVPSLSTLYIDKPLRAHTLMQAIARANRIHEGKNNGEIVDYIDGYKSLLKALAKFAVRPKPKNEDEEGEKEEEGLKPEDWVKKIEELAKVLEEVLQAVENYLKEELGFDLQKIIDAPDKLHRLKAIEEGVNAICVNDDTRKRFMILAREVFTKYKAILHKRQIANQYQARHDAVQVVYKYLKNQEEEADVSDLLIALQKVVDKSIKNIEENFVPYQSNVVDLSGLDFENIKRAFRSSKKKNIETQNLKQRVEKKLLQMVEKNPEREDFYRRYQQIIDEYNASKLMVADSVKDAEGMPPQASQTTNTTFEKLVDFAEALYKEEQRIKREGLTEEQGALFDILKKGKTLTGKNKERVKTAAIELLKRLEADKLKIDRWQEKAEIRSAVYSTIYDHLFENLPFPLYQNKDVDEKTEQIFSYFTNNYGGGSRAV